MLKEPRQAITALRALINSDDVIGTMAQSVKQEWLARINSMEANYQRAGASGAYASGVEAGKLLFEFGGYAVGIGGLAKSGVRVASGQIKRFEASGTSSSIVDDISAKTPTGSKGNPLVVPDGLNKPTAIGGRDFSGHALDRMQRQGITSSVVENAISPQNAVKGKIPGTTAYHDKINNVTVITNTKTGRVVTVDFGIIKQ
ncbi:DUF4258 domain-containing protein [Yersinia sp. Marseille-Q3913]|uniref:DUF4258 domain-containing protein n=1 Tax=Yersinia sp. Marseille-Q3913 TaxID=2830769 RepID=UPI001BAFD8DE|nr:hypothetical protein [Yersinia sp. Marseille-Q3913]